MLSPIQVLSAAKLLPYSQTDSSTQVTVGWGMHAPLHTLFTNVLDFMQWLDGSFTDSILESPLLCSLARKVVGAQHWQNGNASYIYFF